MIYYFYVDPSGNFDEVLLGYNPETHDLVEKKDAKINRLRKEVEELQRLLDFESKVIDERISSLAKRKLELDKLKDELSKAEQE
jgi:RNase H-fold protein (predicted Holliday junction resolvase)